MERNLMPKIAGILDAVLSVPPLGLGLAVLIAGIVGMATVGNEAVIFIFIGVLVTPLGILPLLGAISALRRKRWKLALIGSISGGIVGWMMGVALGRTLTTHQTIIRVNETAGTIGGLLGLGMGILATVLIIASKK